MAYLPNQPSSRLGAAQNVAITAASVASAAFGAQTYQIRCVISQATPVTGTAGVRFRIGDGTPTAVAADSFLPIGTVEYFTVTPGQRIAVVSNDASVAGTVSVTEIV